MDRQATSTHSPNKSRLVNMQSLIPLLLSRQGCRTALHPCRRLHAVRRSMGIAATVELIMPLLLYNLIVETDDQPRRHPLRNKITPLPLAGDLAHQRKPDCPESDPKKGGRR